MTTRFRISATELAGLELVERLPLVDARGSLERIFCRDELAFPGAGQGPAQVNLTRTLRRGTVRGLHYQRAPWGETKLVQCLRGRVFDVAVDLRRGSPTFLRWHGEVLAPDNHLALLIPEGFAHGFQALEDDCEMLYLHSKPYQPAAEGGLHVQDPRLDIRWPLAVSGLSDRDRSHARIDAAFEGLAV